MRRAHLLLLALAALGTGCERHRPALEAAQRDLDLLLLQRREQADSLNEARVAEQKAAVQVEAALALFPLDAPIRARVNALPLPTSVPPPPRAVVTVPAPAAFESDQCGRLRTRLADTAARINDLERVVTEVALLKARLEAQQARLALTQQEPPPR